ncbi:MAG: hypothetical protein AB2693_25335, partial [Candidatus Thiodiazotropha sp.]
SRLFTLCLQGLCRKVSCPIGTAPFYGRCKQLVSTINGLKISVQYYLDVIWNPDGLFTDYAYYIFERFLELVNLNPDCDICRKMIDMTKGKESESELILVIALNFTTKCDYNLALRQLSNMRGKVIEVRVNGASVLTLLVRSDEQPTSDIRQGSLRTIFFPRSMRCSADYTLFFEEMICPHVELQYTELELLSQAKTREKDIFASFFKGSWPQQTVSKVHVCLETYISVMSLNCALPTEGKMTLQILPAVLYVFIVK